MELEGNLRAVDLPEILQQVAGSRDTGILTIQGEDDIIAVSFLRGEIVAADALNEPVEESLGQILSSQGLVSPEDFSRVLAEQQSSGEPLTELLVAQGVVERDRLLDAMRVQIYRVLLQLLSWREGEFRFYGGDEVSFEDGFQPITIEELLMRSLSDLGGEGPLTGEIPDMETIYERQSDGRLIKVVGEDGDQPDPEPGVVWLTAQEKSVLNRLDGTRPTSAVVAETGLGQYRVLFLLYRLLQVGLVHPQEKEPEVTAPASHLPPLTPPEPEPETEFAPLIPPPPTESAPPLRKPPRARPQPRPRVATEKRVARPVSSAVDAFVSRILALTLAFPLMMLVVSEPSRRFLLLPYPWLEAQRVELESHQRDSIYLKIDRAARTYHLLHSRYPEELSILNDLGLLALGDLYDPQGRWISYSTIEGSYTVQPLEGGETVPGTERSVEISGDFLLNPEFLRLTGQQRERPLVLLN